MQGTTNQKNSTVMFSHTKQLEQHCYFSNTQHNTTQTHCFCFNKQHKNRNSTVIIMALDSPCVL